MTDSTAPQSRVRDIDVVVYGATGFVGALVARHLDQAAPEGTRIALAGRSEKKLAAVREGLSERARSWPLLVA
ncbi:MAG TPA: saccharopine dehydrogenase, partial [Streptomyces sp.]|nr:saccharopine dehydrogenase [Streptomyces sp.]